MEYKLAKELKDAGFPNIRIGQYFEHTMGSHSDTRDSEPCYCNEDKIPTLSELIEACGVRFGSLGRDWLDAVGRFWCAIDRGPEETVPPRIECTGATAEEAVARLWLALNPITSK